MRLNLPLSWRSRRVTVSHPLRFHLIIRLPGKDVTNAPNAVTWALNPNLKDVR